MNIREMMSTDLITCNPNETLAQASQRMADGDVGFLPVVVQEQLVGVITDRDIVARAISKGLDPNSTHVSGFMTTELIFGSPDMSHEEACQLMMDHQIRRLPIVENSRLIGVIGLADLALDLEEEQEEEAVGHTYQKIAQPSKESHR